MTESDDETKTFRPSDGSLQSFSEEEEDSISCRETKIVSEEKPTHNEIKRGRPVGKVDSNQRYRRTAQEISDDKISIAKMKLDAMMEKEALEIANKKISQRRGRPAPVVANKVSIAPQIENVKRPIVRSILKTSREKNPEPDSDSDRSPSPAPLSAGRRRQSLYDSWFPSSPRTSHAY